MLKNFRIVAFVFLLSLVGNNLSAQNEGFKDVILDGKPAKLNLKTGEITLITPEKPEVVKTEIIKTETSDKKMSVAPESDFHIVKENERLTDIAKQYNISLVKLMEANNLETTLVTKGQKLKVGNFDVVTTLPSKAPKTSPTSYHLVKEGETLYSLSKRYGLTVDELKRINSLPSNLIKVNEYLRVEKLVGTTDSSLDNYTVSKGDTLYSIAKRNNISVEQLKTLNKLSDNRILIGQKLRVK